MKSTDFVVNERPRLAAVKRFPAVEFADYERRLANIQETLQRVQQAYLGTSHRAIIVLEGWDTAGKGGVVRRLGWALDPRSFKVHAIAAPTVREKSLHYLQRFWERLPEHGQIVGFDRSWYGRVWSSGWRATRRRRSGSVPMMRSMTSSGCCGKRHAAGENLLHITPEEQAHRFRARLTDPLKRWKLSYEDFRNRDRWKEYEAAIEDMLEKTSAKRARWHLVPANNKPFGRLAAFRIIADQLSLGVDLQPRPLDPMVAEAAEQLLGIRLTSVNHHGH